MEDGVSDIIRVIRHVLKQDTCAIPAETEAPARGSDSGLDFSFGKETGIVDICVCMCVFS